MNSKNTTKMPNNKIPKGLVSLITIIIVLSSILASTIYYENNITANVISEASTDETAYVEIKEVNSLRKLSQLNEGWYSVRSGLVFYLESFDSYVPLYIRVASQSTQNGIFAVDEDGNIEFTAKSGISAAETAEIKGFEEKSAAATITGRVAGMEE